MYIVKPHPCTHPSMVEHSSEINRLLVSLAPVAQGGLEVGGWVSLVQAIRLSLTVVSQLDCGNPILGA